jgi:hypothetical protein
MKAWSRRLAMALLAAAVAATACERQPVDGAGRRAAAQARLEAVVGAFPRSPAGGEAGARLLAAAQAVETDKDLRAVLRRMAKQRVSEWSAEDRLTLERALGERSAALRGLHLAAATGPAGLGISAPPPGEKFPDLLPLLGAVRVLTLEGRAALRRGDLGRAAEDAQTVVRVLEATQREPWALTQMVAGSLERDALELLAEAIAVGDEPSSELLTAGLRDLEQIPGLAWIAGEASFAASVLEARDESLPDEAIALDAAVRDLVIARLYERYADMAAAVAGGHEAFASWRDDWQREEAEHRRKPSAAWLRWIFSRRSQAEWMADMLADLLFGGATPNAEKRLTALPARRLAVLAAELAASGRRAGSLPESIAPLVAARRADFAGELPAYQGRDDGSARLALPRTEAVWRQRFGSTELVPLRFEWEIPSPPAQSSNRKRGAPTPLPRS